MLVDCAASRRGAVQITGRQATKAKRDVPSSFDRAIGPLPLRAAIDQNEKNEEKGQVLNEVDKDGCGKAKSG